jgi:hypothetical protein
MTKCTRFCSAAMRVSFVLCVQWPCLLVVCSLVAHACLCPVAGRSELLHSWLGVPVQGIDLDFRIKTVTLEDGTVAKVQVSMQNGQKYLPSSSTLSAAVHEG